jgi:hypothetical protein
MKKEKKKTFTYSGRPSVKKKAFKRAKKGGTTLSEVIDAYLEEYADSPVIKYVGTGESIEIESSRMQ